ncbi:Cdc37 N terminal kinase binding-domain-containing protein [Fimicolochytrium jonesii]|uniref:Cdc37 N terminal kinase binding-domain-containing protein n=1 Tax=Fimicolochytrium jonesii TaxID=1396493 RepID=UPI0022FDC5BD|nr:Cdc37 N terminal kinase binding-domain-containing protein [Fimicolochytrium jonesii]KAI8823751.1 Cdc37 N terminal kinase binding-domain-containing protein [Fimicolochytrium jonesii]
MPVDYSKWDKLELSDDEDFECHPNVDKASMVRWRQADIHRKRRERKDKLQALAEESTTTRKAITALTQITRLPPSTNPAALTPAITLLNADFQKWEQELRESYLKAMMRERDARWGAPEPDAFVQGRVPYGTYTEGILAALNPTPEARGERDTADVKAALEKSVDEAIRKLETRQRELDAEVQREEAEAKKKLTTDDLKEGFNKTIVSKPAAAPPSTTKTSQKTIETIHTPSIATTSATAAPAAGATQPTEEEDDDEADHITFPPAQLFADALNLDQSFGIISAHPALVSQRYSDMILAEGFRMEMARKPKEAKRCVHQALLLQYCSLLGKDGVNLFFARLRSSQPSATAMFLKDVNETYTRIQTRVRTLHAEQAQQEAAERAALQQRLEACTLPDGSYALPVGEEADEKERRRAEVFAGLERAFQRALLLSDVDEINAHLASLSKTEGEELVRRCSEVGLLDLEIEGGDGDGGEEEDA